MNSTITTGQRIALSHLLTEWPDDLPFDQILHYIKLGHDEITKWEGLENWNDLILANFIEELSNNIDNEIKLSIAREKLKQADALSLLLEKMTCE